MKTAALTDQNYGGKGRVNILSNDHLTQKNSALLEEAQNLGNIGYKFVWSRNRMVLVRFDSDSRIKRIESSAQIEELTNKAKN